MPDVETFYRDYLAKQTEKAAARAIGKAMTNFAKKGGLPRLLPPPGPVFKSPKDVLMALSGTLRKPAPGKLSERGVCFRILKAERMAIKKENRKRERAIEEAGL